jgi:diguanylate cyclase (GGDEF)-like protein
VKNITTSLGFRLTVASYLVVAIFMSIAGITVYRVSKDSIKLSAMAMVNRMAEELALVPAAPPEELGDRLQRVKVRKSGSTWIMDRDGNLLYNPDPLFREEYIVKKKNFGNIQVVLQAASPRVSGQGSFKEKLVDILQKYEEGFGTYRQFGEERILAFRTLPGRGLLIGVDEPVSSANSELERIKKFISYTALVSALLIMAFNLLAIRIIIKPYYREMEDLNASLRHSNNQLEDLNGKLAVSNRNLTTLYDVGLGLRHSLALRDILALIVNGAHQVLDVDRIAVFLPAADGSSLELRSLAGETMPAHLIRVPLTAQGGGLATSFQRKEPVRLEEGQKIPPSLRLGPPSATEPFLRSRAFIVVPLVVKDRAVGVIAVDNKSRRGPISEEQVNLLGIFANQAAVAVDNARLYEQLRQKIDELDSRVDQLSILHQIGNSMQRDITRQEALGFILRGVLEGIGFSQVAVALVNRGEGTLRGELGLGMENADVKSIDVPLLEEKNLFVMAATRKAPVGIVLFNRTGLGELMGTALGAGAWRESIGSEVPGACAAVVAVPLIAREEVVGVIGVVRTEPALIRRHEIELLLLYANTAALTIERAELYTHLQNNVESLAVTDHVSRLFTLHHGQQRTREEITRCGAAGLSFAGLMLGVDAFKDYNDRCGHDLGDRLLAELGELVKSTLRGGDIAFRYGGRLIAVALPGASQDQAALIVDGLRDRLRRHRFQGPDGQRDQVVTLSIGLESWAVGTSLPAAADMFKIVLGRLQRAESEGGNHVSASEG